MNASEMVRSALASAGKTQKALAKYMGWSPQNLSRRLKNDSLTFDEMTKALSFAGYAVKMTDADGAELPTLNNSDSPRLVQMVEGRMYDTGKAESLCTSKEAHSDELYMELFRDATGAYFLAYYQLWDGGHNYITPVSEIAARKFWERYSSRPVDEFE